jgi:hypothetical protein
MRKRNLREHFKEGWNKLFGKEQDKGRLRTQSLYRARQKDIKLNAGTPHDWEDLEKYQEEINKD